MRPSADLAGRSVGISIDVPAVFDVPLAPHHKLIGRWAASREKPARRYTRDEARRRIERVFEAAVLEILGGIEIADLRVVALIGDADLPPAIAVICDSIGQLDLGWIENSNVLSDTLFSTVAPVGWRAAAYRALEDTLPRVLPVFNYDDLLEEISAYYWDGETDDEGARRVLIDWHGHDPDDVAEMTLPSEMKARRPDFMTAKAAPLKHMPPGLCQRLRNLREAHKAVAALAADGNAWRCDTEHYYTYFPGAEDCSYLPPLTLVPFEHFAREIDDVARCGMEQGFMDLAGISLLPDAGKVDDWLASLRLGAELLRAAQELIDLDPAKR